MSLTFHKYLCWLTYVDATKDTNKHKHTQTQKTHTHTYTRLLTSKYTYINTCINIYIHTYIH